MPKRRPSSVHIALVASLALALLLPAAATAGSSTTVPGGATAETSKKKCKKGKKGKKCKKKKGGPVGGGPVGGAPVASPAGQWTGAISSNGSAVSFSVSAGAASVDNFAVPLLPVFCFNGGLTTRVFLVPSAPVSGGAFATTIQTTDDGGQVDGSMELSGQLTNDSASGSLRYNRAGCGSGPITWTATKK